MGSPIGKKNICFHKIQIQCYKNITNVFILSSPTGFRALSTRGSSFRQLLDFTDFKAIAVEDSNEKLSKSVQFVNK